MNKPPQNKIIEDAILTGILKAYGCTYTPQRDPFGKVVFRIEGDVEGTLEKIYGNKPVGALDVLQAIKNARQAIFSLKGNGHEKGDNYGNRRY